MKKIVAFVASHWKTAAITVAGIAIAIYQAIANARLSSALLQEKAERQRLQTEVAKTRDFYPVIPTSPGKVEAALSPEAKADLEAIRKTVKETAVALHALTTAKIESTAPGTMIPATAEHPAICEDAFHRFRVNMSDCSFTIGQSFIWEGTLLRGVDGRTKLYKATLTELDPVTGLKIPGVTPELKSEIQITEEIAPEKAFGLKLLAGIDERWAPGLGIQFAEKWRLSPRLVGFYAPKTKDLRGLAGLAWRPYIPFFDSALSVGAGIGLSTQKSGLIYGAHLMVPLGTFTK